MSSASSSTVEEKVKDIIQSWQSSQEALSSKYGTLPALKEPPNAIALVMHLLPVEVKKTLEKLSSATDEEKKAHKALRTTFAVVKIISSGWSFVETDGEKTKGKGKGPAAASANGVKERLAFIDDGENGQQHVIFHTYKAENKKGVYTKSKRLDECLALSPGMVINAMIWGDKIIPTFNEMKEDIAAFQFGIAQLYIKSNMASSSVDSGRMLEVKNFTSLDSTLYSPSSFKILKTEGILANSIQAAEILKERFLDGSLISEGKRSHLNQSLIQGSLSSTVKFLALTPNTSNGLFGMGADGKIKFFLHQPIADVRAYAINLTFDRKAHYCPPDGSNDEWMIKLLNVGIMLDAVQLLVTVDSYKNKDVPESDLVLEGFARVDLSAVLKKILACGSASELGQGAEEDMKKKAIVSVFEAQGMGQAVKNLYLYPLCAPNLDLVIDTRKMNNKRFEDMDDSFPHSTTLVHHDARWKKGHMLYAFFDGKSVLSAIIPVDEGGAALFNERAKRGLESVVQFADHMKDVEFEEEEPTLSAMGGSGAQSETMADGAGKGASSSLKKKAKTTGNPPPS